MKTTRRGFLKGMAAAAGALIARPALPDLLAVEPEIETEAAVDVIDRLPPMKPLWPMKVGIGRGSPRMLDNLGIHIDFDVERETTSPV